MSDGLDEARLQIMGLCQKLEAAQQTLGRIVIAMREPRMRDDVLLSEIQDHLTIGGYDVPLRSYLDAPEESP